jgi:hypothetical protein
MPKSPERAKTEEILPSTDMKLALDMQDFVFVGHLKSF